jgi:serine protease Do
MLLSLRFRFGILFFNFLCLAAAPVHAQTASVETAAPQAVATASDVPAAANPVAAASARPITDEAEKLYGKFQKAVYQIQVIDLASGKKSVIGSGFQFTHDGYLATNFHVVSDAVNSPKRFNVQSLSYDGTITPVEIVTVDVIHDLSILKSKEPGPEFLEFGSSDLPKGTRVFSMGNPHDLGMSIVEGTYNGLLEKSLYRKIHFSGALNGGMSGGPALDYQGHLVGVNVSTYGNQVSFLVPIDYLKDLFNTIKDEKVIRPKEDWSLTIQDQLVANQSKLVDELLKAKWEVLPIGDAEVAGEMTQLFKCWGDSKDNDEDLYSWASLRCSSQDEIFLSQSHQTGQVIYNYLWVQSKGLNTFRFYHLYEHWFSQPYEFDNAKKDDVRNFRCTSHFVRIADEDWKATLCARQYKKFPALYDINLNLASTGHFHHGLLVEMVALGITQEKSSELIRKFMGAIHWKK